jgi:hypothetical protein
MGSFLQSLSTGSLVKFAYDYKYTALSLNGNKKAHLFGVGFEVILTFIY